MSSNLTAHKITEYLDKTENGISISKQTELLGISRSSFYYNPKPPSAEDIDLMNRADKIHIDFPEYGTRTMAAELTRQVGFSIGRKRAGTIMKIIGIEAIYPKPNLSKANMDHLKYPYLLKGVEIMRPNHVWSADITYIRMKSGFLYLVAYMDWYSRYILSWRLSNTMETDFCIEAAFEALKQAVPDIFNSDQGVQFTDKDLTNIWQEKNIQISMDHKGRCFDNIFIERFWRTLKYNEVYLKDYQNYREAYLSIAAYMDKYNNRRLHKALGYKTPAEIYFGN